MPVCPSCYSRELIKFGKYDHKQKWHCLKCGYTTTSPRQRIPKKEKEVNNDNSQRIYT